MNKIKYITHNKKGFTLLFAVLVSTLVVSIGATIISIALRQTILSGTSRESQYAFYAANTALECAHYWDVIGAPGNNDSSIVFPAPIEGEIQTDIMDSVSCSGVNLVKGPDNNSGTDDDLVTEDMGGNSNATTFFLKIKDQASLGLPYYEYCAQVIVKKSLQNNQGNTVVETTIETKGYNTCDENSPRRVERGLIQQYQS